MGGGTSEEHRGYEGRNPETDDGNRTVDCRGEGFQEIDARDRKRYETSRPCHDTQSERLTRNVLDTVPFMSVSDKVNLNCFGPPQYNCRPHLLKDTVWPTSHFMVTCGGNNCEFIHSADTPDKVFYRQWGNG